MRVILTWSSQWAMRSALEIEFQPVSSEYSNAFIARHWLRARGYRLKALQTLMRNAKIHVRLHAR